MQFFFNGHDIFLGEERGKGEGRDILSKKTSKYVIKMLFGIVVVIAF
jgi:hypothetical protein